MKTYLKILSVFIVLMSCQDHKNVETNLNSDKEIASKRNDVEKLKQNQPSTTLTKAQLNEFFPKQIGDYKLINVSVIMSNSLASATYVMGNDYNHSMTYSLEDGNRKSSAIVRNFNDSYNIKPQGPEETQYIYQERDGYKTIAFLQPTIKRNEISFVYNDRFRLTLEGANAVDTLWSYFDVENLNRLNNYQ